MGDLFNWFVDIPMGVLTFFWTILFWFIVFSICSIIVREAFGASFREMWRDIKHFFWSKGWDIKLWWQRFRSK